MTISNASYEGRFIEATSNTLQFIPLPKGARKQEDEGGKLMIEVSGYHC